MELLNQFCLHLKGKTTDVAGAYFHRYVCLFGVNHIIVSNSDYQRIYKDRLATIRRLLCLVAKIFLLTFLACSK